MTATPHVPTYLSEFVVPQGPFGGPRNPHAFYDGVGDIVQIKVSYSDLVFYSLQVVYQQGAAKFTTSRHGGAGPKTFTVRSYISE